MGQTYGQAALPIARQEIGVKEHPPGSNDGPRVRAYLDGHEPEAWCADFGTWCLVRAGMPRPTWNRSYCPSWLEAARAGVAGMHVLGPNEPLETGLVVLYDWGRDGIVDHYGLLERVSSATSFLAIEGNTSPTSDSNGGAVMLRSRRRSDVGAFIRLPQVPVAAKPWPPPFSGSLRIDIGGHPTFAGWGSCIGVMRNIAAHGLDPHNSSAISWKGHTWRGARDVAAVTRHLLAQYVD